MRMDIISDSECLNIIEVKAISVAVSSVYQHFFQYSISMMESQYLISAIGASSLIRSLKNDHHIFHMHIIKNFQFIPCSNLDRY